MITRMYMFLWKYVRMYLCKCVCMYVCMFVAYRSLSLDPKGKEMIFDREDDLGRRLTASAISCAAWKHKMKSFITVGSLEAPHSVCMYVCMYKFIETRYLCTPCMKV